MSPPPGGALKDHHAYIVIYFSLKVKGFLKYFDVFFSVHSKGKNSVDK